VNFELENERMKSSASGSPLLVFCAASVEPAVVPIAAAFQRETGVAVQFEVGPSGPLIERMRREKRGDLFIPASQQPFLDRCQSDGTVSKVLPLASLKLVLAVKPGKSDAITLKDLLAGKARYAISHEESAAGLATLEAIAPLGDWQPFAEGAQTILPTVTEVAHAIRDSAEVDCGIVWDATARQYGLTVIEFPELDSSKSVIAAGVLATSGQAEHAQKFAAYLASPEKGGAYFKMLGYSAIAS
jgi:molybdate transport system substrate-binding protein